MVLGVNGLGAASIPAVSQERPSASTGAGGAFRSVLEQTRGAVTNAGRGHQVMPSRTPLSGSQASEAIRSAYVAVTGEQPSRGTLAILTSHWALETGQGKSMYNYNFAGIKGRGPEGMTAVMNTREGFGDHAVKIRDGFRAYTSAEAGARDYVSLLQRKYGNALEAARAEAPARFAEELKAGGYYTGDPALYAKGVTQLANRAMEHGFDALGTTAGALTRGAQPFEPYFAPPPSGFSGSSPYPSASGTNPFDNLGLAMDGFLEPNTASVESLRDEMSRTALLIAAQRGAV